MTRLILHDIRTWAASIRRLQSDRISLMPSPEPNGLDAICHTTEGLGGGLAEMGATFHWPISQMLLKISELNPRQLAGLEVNPEHLRAYRDGYALFFAGAYVQASQAFDMIDLKRERGALRWRVHFLKGLLRLGFAGHDPEHFDCDLGRTHFDSTADLTATHAPSVAAQALVLAAQCSWLGSRDEEAFEYAEAAADLDPHLGEAYFIMSRLLLADGYLMRAISLGLKATQQDARYALRLAAQDIWVSDASALRGLMSALSVELKRTAAPIVKEGLARLRLLAEHQPAYSDPDVVFLRQVLRRDAPCPVYDLLRLLQEPEKTVNAILSRYDGVRLAGRRERTGDEVHYHAVITKTEMRRTKVVTKGGLFGNKEEVAWIDKPFEREYLRSRSARLRTLTLTIKDISGATLCEADLQGLPSGGFKMGSPQDQIGRKADETRHTAFLSRPFYIGVMPVTQALWRAVMGNNPSYFSGPERPVEQVSWVDAALFCNALSQIVGLEPAFDVQGDDAIWRGHDARGFRLPTEAEWEYACRAGQQGAFQTGEVIDAATQANVERRHDAASSRVGLFPPNTWGLHDMHGNVAEWCLDAYQSDLGAETVYDPYGDAANDLRVTRGGAWASLASESRCASRAQLSKWNRRATVGIRLALAFDPAA